MAGNQLESGKSRKKQERFMRVLNWEDRDSDWAKEWYAQCIEHLRNDGLAILPTETGYMLAANGLSEVALEALYIAKGRPSGQATHLAVSHLEEAKKIVRLGTVGERLLSRWSPGPVTVIGDALDGIPRRILGPEDSLGVRIPDHPGTLKLLKALACPLTTTSANLAGATHERTMRGILSQFPETVSREWFLLVDDARKYENPSTMLKVHTDDSWTVIREGAISTREIQRALTD